MNLHSITRDPKLLGSLVAVVGLIVATPGLAAWDFTGGEPEAGAGDASTAAEQGAYTYPCPPGQAIQRTPDVCVGTLSSFEGHVEPFLAVDPNDPDRMAVGVNTAATTHAVNPLEDAGAYKGRLDVFITEDGGETWRLVHIPQPGLTTTMPPQLHRTTLDPTLAFDSEGRLHVAGMMAGFFGVAVGTPDQGISNLTAPSSAFHTSSPDGGRTWTEPTVFHQAPRTDRPWLMVGEDDTVYITYEHLSGISHVLWSTDGGASWQDLLLRDCFFASPPHVHDGQLLVGCTDVGNDRLRVLAVHPAVGEVEELSTLPEDDPDFMRLLTAPDGALYLMVFAHEPVLYRSSDDGRTWVTMADVEQALSPAFEPANSELMWMEISPVGHLQVLVRSGETMDVLHAVVDLADNTRIALSQLTPESGERPGGATRHDIVGDHFFGIGVVPDGIALVWTWDLGIDYTVTTRAP